MNKSNIKINSSKEIAKERLKSILIKDRVSVSNDLMDSVKDDMLNVASDYFKISEKNSEIYLTNMPGNAKDSDDTVLVCIIPIYKMRTANNQGSIS